MPTDRRLEQLQQWINEVYPDQQGELTPASSDASFRRYFRLQTNTDSLIVMDAPPEKENSQPFVEIGTLLESEGLPVPHILAHDLQQGFILLSDLGTESYLDKLNSERVDRLYGDAMEALQVLQICTPHEQLPVYDAQLLQREMQLFSDWFLAKELAISLDQGAKKIIQNSFDQLSEAALQQPRCFVHRDFHSRNLMFNTEHNPGIIDFQDAVSGPITYDLVSLLKDCYIRWPRDQVIEWVKNFQKQWFHSSGIEVPREQYLRWFDLMGMQRHLKAIGIFARLNHRDGKSGYLKDIPRTFAYILEVCEIYPELQSFAQLMHELKIEEKLSK